MYFQNLFVDLTQNRIKITYWGNQIKIFGQNTKIIKEIFGVFKNIPLLWGIDNNDGAVSPDNREQNTMNTLNIYNGLSYSTNEINQNFKIKVHGVNHEGPNMNKLVGVSGLIRLIGVELTNILLNRAFNCPNDKCVCKLRRGICITFYIH